MLVYWRVNTGNWFLLKWTKTRLLLGETGIWIKGAKSRAGSPWLIFCSFGVAFKNEKDRKNTANEKIHLKTKRCNKIHAFRIPSLTLTVGRHGMLKSLTSLQHCQIHPKITKDRWNLNSSTPASETSRITEHEQTRQNQISISCGLQSTIKPNLYCMNHLNQQTVSSPLSR